MTGLLLALFSAHLTLISPNFLRGYIKRPWLYNIDVVPVDRNLFLIAAGALLAGMILDWLLLRRRLKSIPSSRILIIGLLLLVLLVPLKNSALQHTLFFAVAGLASVLIFVSSPGLERKSMMILEKLWSRVQAVSSRNWIFLIFFSSLAFHLCCALFLLDAFPHTLDEIDYFSQAKIFARGRLWAVLPEPRQFFHFINMVEKDGRWFAQYPPGWPALLAIGVKLGVPWAVNPLLGALMVLLIFFLARELFDEKTARLSSLLALFSPYFIIMNSTMMSHTSCAAALLAFLILLWRAGQRKSRGQAFFAFFFLGLAATIRPYSAFLVWLPGMGLMIYELRKYPVDILRFLPGLALGFGIPLSLFLYYNHLTTGSALVFGYQYLHGNTGDLGFGPRQFPFPHTFFEGLIVLHSRMVLISERLFESAAPALALAVLPFVLAKPNKKLVWLAALFLSVPIGQIFYFGNDMTYSPRYIFEGVPALVILCAAGIKAGRDRWRGNRSLAHYALVVILLAFLIFIPSQILSYRSAGDIGPELQDELKAKKVTHSLVLIEELYFPMGMILQSPFLDGDNIYARDLPGRGDEIISRFPGRPVWIFRHGKNSSPFVLERLDRQP